MIFVCLCVGMTESKFCEAVTRADGKPRRSRSSTRLQRPADMFPATGLVTPNSEARCCWTQTHEASLKAFSRSFGGRPHCLAQRSRSAFVWDPHPTLWGPGEPSGGGGGGRVGGWSREWQQSMRISRKTNSHLEEHVCFSLGREKGLQGPRKKGTWLEARIEAKRKSIKTVSVTLKPGQWDFQEEFGSNLWFVLWLEVFHV